MRRAAVVMAVLGVTVSCAPPARTPASTTTTTSTTTSTTTTTTSTTTSTTTTTTTSVARPCSAPAHPAPGAASGWEPAAVLGDGHAAALASSWAPRTASIVWSDGGRPHATRTGQPDTFVADVLAGGGEVLAIGEPVRVGALAPAVTPEASDPLREQQWALDSHDFERSWGCGTGSGVTVAVLDTGVDAEHPDLVGKVAAGPSFVGVGDGVEGAGGTDPNGHGTHVAGIIAAVVGNGEGIAGAAPGASILAVGVLDAAASGWDDDVANGIVWATDTGAQVINLSLGSTTEMPATREALGYAASRGVVVVAAAGNTRDGGAWNWPAAYSEVIAVASAAASSAVSSFSTSGPYVDVSAGGEAILSTLSGAAAVRAQGPYGFLSGTSMAAPHVSALAAMLVASVPERDAAGMIRRLCVGARDLDRPGWDPRSGCGAIVASAAMAGDGR